MKKYELLSPAGDFSCLRQAVFHGADAVYLGGKKFGARMFAANFEEEEMIEAVRFCHLYGVKIYVTVNTMIYEEEVEACLKYVTFLHEIGVDAVIMQDIGMISLVRKTLPRLEIHASTQAHNHNREGLKELKKLGVKRVVLARELSLEEIDQLDVKIEKEVFIHGALCISYSGQCLFSSMLLDRSGNRGSCAGICRLPFDLLKNGEKVETEGPYLLSAREINTSPSFTSLLERNITAFKIEGRMKGPAYVGWITQFYRDLIDQYVETGSISITDQQIKEMKLLYNREFSLGWLFFDNHDKITNVKTPNHIGVPLGNVIEITEDKVKIKLVEDLNQEDGIRFAKDQTGMMVNFLYNDQGLLVNHLGRGEIAWIDKKFALSDLQEVWKTLDSKLIRTLEKVEEKKIPIQMEAIVEIGSPLYIVVSDGKEKESIIGSIVEEAKTSPMKEERIREQLEKVGETPFQIERLKITVKGNIFIPISALNEARRMVLEQLKEKRSSRKKEVVIVRKEEKEEKKVLRKPKISVLVRTEEQLKVAIEKEVDICYVTDTSLYEKYREDERIFLCTPRVRNTVLPEQERLLIGELGGMGESISHKRGDFYLNISNHETVRYYAKRKAESICLSVEMKEDQIISLMKKNLPSSCEIESLVFGYIEVMVMKYCPLNKVLMKGKKPCNLCKNGRYQLKDRKDSLYLLKQEGELTHLFYHKPINRFDEVSSWLAAGISIFRLDFLEEDPSWVGERIDQLRMKLNLAENGK